MKAKSAIMFLAVFLGFSAPANAVLIDRGTGMIYDTELGITWLQDANYAQTSGYDADGRMSWHEAMTWVDQLSYGGFNDWRLPRANPVNGVAHNLAWSDDGSTDLGYNISAPGSVYPQSKANEMAYMYYNNLGNIAYHEASNTPPNGGLKNTGPFINLEKAFYYSSTPFHYTWINDVYDIMPEGDYIFSLNFSQGNQGNSDYNADDMAWAVRDGDYGPSVSTTQTYLTDYLTLGDNFTFDYWWEMGIEPTENNFDVLFFNGTEWETFGWELNFNGSSTEWETASFWVPEWARGKDVQIKFSLFDWGQETDPTVYLRNIGSAPVPEPATIILLGTGLIGLAAGASRRKFRE